MARKPATNKTLDTLHAQAFEKRPVTGFNPAFIDPAPSKRETYVGMDGIERLLC